MNQLIIDPACCDSYTSAENAQADGPGLFPCRRCGRPEKDHPWETWTAATKIELTPVRNRLDQRRIRGGAS